MQSILSGYRGSLLLSESFSLNNSFSLLSRRSAQVSMTIAAPLLEIHILIIGMTCPGTRSCLEAFQQNIPQPYTLQLLCLTFTHIKYQKLYFLRRNKTVFKYFSIILFVYSFVFDGKSRTMMRTGLVLSFHRVHLRIKLRLSNMKADTFPQSLSQFLKEFRVTVSILVLDLRIPNRYTEEFWV